jgi:hypothetical protein
MNDLNNIANPGSTLGEAVGALIEAELNRVLRPIAENHDCVYVSSGRPNPRTGKPTKLLLKDISGNEFNIDAVIANQRMQPLVLIESKYIRYKKHNRDKGSWICTAHYSLRRSYPTVRSSLAVLAGNWSRSSKAMMNSFDVNLFEIGFPKIVQVLSTYGIDFNWGEKERDKAIDAWNQWQRLQDSDYARIAQILLEDIEPEIRQRLDTISSSTISRQIHQIELSIETTLGETRLYTFTSINDAIEFLENFEADSMLDTADGRNLWEL